MNAAPLFPIQNCVINGYSLIENIFGASFVVYDAMGVMLTTANNIRLFKRAQTLVENLSLYDAQGLGHALASLRQEADRLLQADYDLAFWREYQSTTTQGNSLSGLVRRL